MPSQWTVRLENNDQVRTGFNEFRQAAGPIAREDVKEAQERALKKSIPYRGGSSYDVPERGYPRTGNLGRGGQVVVEGLSVRIEVSAYREGSNRDYSEYVVGRGDGSGQAQVHEGYWIPTRQAVDEEVDVLTSGQLDDDLQAEANKAGLND